MVDWISISISLLSLCISSYALYENKKNSFKSTVARSIREVAVGATGRNLSPNRERFLSREERRELIAQKARDPQALKNAQDIAKAHHSTSGHIPPDPDAQTNLPAFRSRYNRKVPKECLTQEGR